MACTRTARLRTLSRTLLRKSEGRARAAMPGSRACIGTHGCARQLRQKGDLRCSDIGAEPGLAKFFSEGLTRINFQIQAVYIS
ncbi:hypothetical protein [Cupriavidus sp. D39]|uniref:hypothetical protein n=1 Tax=Cupriavidus sp. D39 TaxID=2997877 RepID=UPI0022717B5F|nr:hypothetical protein [Cupriavidus sp. D39]MCY0855833.1 hypothetical protein [Cupriavidus sp. D39]